MDISESDVHVPTAVGQKKPVTLGTLDAKTRNALPDKSFALPKQRKYPLENASHARNALARLEQNKGRLSPADYASAKRRILQAYKKFGIQSKPAGVRAKFKMSFSHPVYGNFAVHKLSNGQDALFCHQGLHADVGAPNEQGWRWIQLAKSGHFEGHHSGVAFDLNDQVFSDLIRNFESVDGRRVAFDFEHASEMPPTSGNIAQEGAPAQGWIHELKAQGGNLWALVEWLEPAKSLIREKKYQFVSPAIRPKSIHPSTGVPIGARLSSAALTNKPFLRGMLPIAASDGTVTYAAPSHHYMPAIRKAMKLSELCTATECMDAVGQLQEHVRVGGGEDVHGVPVGQYLSDLREQLGLPMTCEAGEMLEAVAAMIEAAMDEHEEQYHGVHASDEGDEGDEDMTMTDQEKAVLMKDAEVKEAALTLRLNQAETKADGLEKELLTLRDEIKKRDEQELAGRVQEAFETYQDKNKLTPAHKRMMTIHCLSDREDFERMYPRIQGGERHLARNLTGAREQVGPTAPGSVVHMSARAESRALLLKGIPFDQAQELAERRARAQGSPFSR